MTGKKIFFKQVNSEIAKNYNTTPEVIAYVRSYGMARFKLIPLMDHVESKIPKLDIGIQTTIKSLMQIKPIDDPEKEKLRKEKDLLRQKYIDHCYAKKGFLLTVYIFLKKLNDGKFTDITRPIKYKK